MTYHNGPRIITDGLVLLLDAGNNKSYSGTGTSWFDLSGNNNNGTLTNGPTYSAANKGSIAFDGTNDYIECGSNTTITTISGLTNFTLEIIVMWNSVPTAGNGHYFMANVNPTGVPPNLTGGFQFGYIPNHGFTFATYGNNSSLNGNGSFDGIPSVIFTPSINTWYHVVGLKLTTGYYLYLNNNLWSSYLTSSNGGNAPTSLKIGLRERDLNFAAQQRYLNGRISLAKIYNRGLSLSELSQNYNALKGRYNL